MEAVQGRQPPSSETMRVRVVESGIARNNHIAPLINWMYLNNVVPSDLAH